MIVQNVSESSGVTDISFTVPHSELDEALAICEQKRPRSARRGSRPTTASPR